MELISQSQEKFIIPEENKYLLDNGCLKLLYNSDQSNLSSNFIRFILLEFQEFQQDEKERVLNLAKIMKLDKIVAHYYSDLISRGIQLNETDRETIRELDLDPEDMGDNLALIYLENSNISCSILSDIVKHKYVNCFRKFHDPPQIKSNRLHHICLNLTIDFYPIVAEYYSPDLIAHESAMNNNFEIYLMLHDTLELKCPITNDIAQAAICNSDIQVLKLIISKYNIDLTEKLLFSAIKSQNLELVKCFVNMFGGKISFDAFKFALSTMCQPVINFLKAENEFDERDIACFCGIVGRSCDPEFTKYFVETFPVLDRVMIIENLVLELVQSNDHDSLIFLIDFVEKFYQPDENLFEKDVQMVIMKEFVASEHSDDTIEKIDELSYDSVVSGDGSDEESGGYGSGHEFASPCDRQGFHNVTIMDLMSDVNLGESFPSPPQAIRNNCSQSCKQILLVDFEDGFNQDTPVTILREKNVGCGDMFARREKINIKQIVFRDVADDGNVRLLKNLLDFYNLDFHTELSAQILKNIFDSHDHEEIEYWIEIFGLGKINDYIAEENKKYRHYNRIAPPSKNFVFLLKKGVRLDGHYTLDGYSEVLPMVDPEQIREDLDFIFSSPTKDKLAVVNDIISKSTDSRCRKIAVDWMVENNINMCHPKIFESCVNANDERVLSYMISQGYKPSSLQFYIRTSEAVTQNKFDVLKILVRDTEFRQYKNRLLALARNFSSKQIYNLLMSS